MTKPGPGKFEANESLEIAEALYSYSLGGFVDEQFGSVDENGYWEGLIQNHIMNGPLMKPGYIVIEDNLGFFTYQIFDSHEEAWSKYLADLAAYESHYAK